jgi:hypothetical protein
MLLIEDVVMSNRSLGGLRRRRAPRYRFLGVLTLAGAILAAGAGPAAGLFGDDPLACYRDPSGRPVRAGETVRDVHGQEIGWVSASQCSERTPGRLRVYLNHYDGHIAVVDARDIAEVSNGVTLRIPGEQLRRPGGTMTADLSHSQTS